MHERLTTPVVIATVALLVGTALGAGAIGLSGSIAPPGTDNPEGDDPPWADRSTDFDRFESPDEFEAYFEAAHRGGSGLYSLGGTTAVADSNAASFDRAESASTGDDGGVVELSAASDGAADRHSGTNVQEAALDEPDVLKTDGSTAYYANHRFQRGVEETTVIDIEDPGEPEVAATIPVTGELLLVEGSDMLVVLGTDRMWGYDIADPADPTEVWHEQMDADLQTARLHDGSLYLVLVDRPDQRVGPCPMTPIGDDAIACTEVYRPSAQADADAVYTAARIDPTTGESDADTSVVGSLRDSATYVSEDAIYLSYTRSTGEFDLLFGYLTGPGADHLDAETEDRIEALDDMDISQQAKATELQVIMESWMDSLDEAEREDTMQAIGEGISEYAADHQRELTTTGIVRISLNGDLDVTATGEVPGYPLNQWSMDEHEDHLRIATTIPGVHGTDSVNDVYVLDAGLDETGSVEGLGETERIYSVRFDGDEGYVVTFRQIDPFYTLDLSDPTDPVMEGELKIPGVSHYLHPLADEGDLVLGIGEEDRQVKLSTFDVSDRTDPVEQDVEILTGERFTEVNQNHRAFLQDERHGVFFLPAGESSYVFSYEDGQLVEEARVNIGGPGVRAMYVDDYLYVIGSDEIVVLDETTWEVETRIDTR